MCVISIVSRAFGNMDFSFNMACHGYKLPNCSRAARLVAVLLLHRFDDGHAEVDVGDTVIAFFIHLLRGF